MDQSPPKPPVTELPDLIDAGSSSEQPDHDRQQFTLPSARPQAPVRPGEVVVTAAQPTELVTTMPSGDRARQAQAVMNAELQRARGASFQPSPAMLALAGEILEWSPPQLVRVRYPAHEGWLGTQGTLAAGFVAAMFDPVFEALAWSAYPDRQHALVETSIRFFRSVRSGHVIVDGTALRTGRTTITVECIAWDPGNELCAKGSATLLFVG